MSGEPEGYPESNRGGTGRKLSAVSMKTGN